MYLFDVTVDSTSKRIPILIGDSESPNGAGLTGLVFNTSGLLWTYWREDQGNTGGTAVTLATMTRGTWASGGFKEKDSSLLPGWYELGVPDAALATGSDWVRMQLRGASGMVLADFVLRIAPSPAVEGDASLAVTLGVTFSGSVNTRPTIALGASVDATPAGGSAAADSIALGISVEVTPASGSGTAGSIALGASLEEVVAGDRTTVTSPVTLRAVLGVVVTDTIHFGAIRRGKTAVAVKPGSSGKATVR